MAIRPAQLPFGKQYINFNHPLAKGLVFDWKPNFNTPRVAINNVYGDRASITNTPTSSIRRYGIGVDFGTDADYLFSTKNYLKNFDQITFQTIFIRDSSGGSGYGRLFAHTDSVAGYHWLEVYNDNGDGGWGLSFGCTYASTIRIFSIPYPTNGVVHNLILTWDHTNVNNAPFVLLNGVPQTVTDRLNLGGSYSQTSTTIQFTNATSNVWDGAYFLTRYWKEKIHKNGLYELSRNPGIIYQRPYVMGKAPSSTAYTKTLTDNIITASTLSKLTNKQQSNVINATSAILKAISKNKSDSLNTSENIAKLTSKLENDSIDLSEEISTFKAQFRTLSDSVDASSALIRSLSTEKSDSLDATDDIALGRATELNDAIDLSETILRQTNKTLADAVDATSTVARAVTHALSDVIDVTEDFSTLRAIFETYDDSLNLSETIAKSKTQILSDTIIAVEAFTKYTQKIYADAVDTSESIDTELTGIKQLSDTIIMSEAFTKYLQRVINENVDLSEAYDAIKLYIRGLSDTLDISEIPDRVVDNFASYAGAAYATMAYGGTLFEPNERSLIFDTSRPVSDTFNLSEAFTKIYTFGRVLTDTIIMSDTVTRFLNGVSLIWTKIPKPAAGTWTKIAKQASATWTKITKPSGVWTKQTKYEP